MHCLGTTASDDKAQTFTWEQKEGHVGPWYESESGYNEDSGKAVINGLAMQC